LSNGLLLPVTAPAKATSHTSKLTSLITRFTLAVLECKTISQELMHGLQILNVLMILSLITYCLLYDYLTASSNYSKNMRRIVHDYIHWRDSKDKCFFCVVAKWKRETKRHL
jgi:hypothetical protein